MADFARAGDDLVLTTEGGREVVVEDFFSSGEDLRTDSGQVIQFETVDLLAGPLAPAQIAQASGVPGADPIGQIETAQGDVTATHVSGLTEDLGPGSDVFAGDILITGTNGSLALRFVDGTTLSLDSGARLVVDELVFNPDAGIGDMTLSLIHGALVFATGEIATMHDEAMTVNTSNATLGIRGTEVGALCAIGVECLYVLYAPSAI